MIVMARSGEAGQFGSRRGYFERIGLESQTMRAIDEPDADGVDEFAGQNESGMADDDDDEIAPPARLYFQHREAVLLIVKSHSFDGADKRFAGGSGKGELQEARPWLEL